MQEIQSTQNPVVKAARALHQAKFRAQENAFLVEGEKLCLEALKEGLQIRQLFVQKGFEESEQAARLVQVAQQSFVLSAAALESLCETKTPQPFALVAQLLGEQPLRFPVVALDGVQDPGNLGTIFRTADAAGFSVLLGPGCADPFAPKTVRSTMGSLFRVPFEKTGDLPARLQTLRNEGVRIAATTLDGESFFGRAPLGQRCVLLIGAEGKGISEGALALCTDRYTLPMRGGAESLNAAVAAAIMMYDIFRELS